METYPKPGRELDALVAEKVMGLKPRNEFEGNTVVPPHYTVYLRGNTVYMPRYSTDIAAAWEVVEKMKEMGCVDIQALHGAHYQVQIDRYDGKSWETAFVESTQGDTAPHAISLVALKAVGAL